MQLNPCVLLGLHAAGPRLPGAAPPQRSRLAGAGSLQPATSAQLDAAESGPLGARFLPSLLMVTGEDCRRGLPPLKPQRDGFDSE